MSLFDQAIKTIEENKYRRDNCIPFSSILPRFSDYLPGIQKKRYYLISGASGSGKSQLTDHLFVFTPYDFIREHETDIKLKIFYYSIELDKESKIHQWILRRLFENYGIRIDLDTLLSIKKSRVSDDVFMAVQETRNYFEEMEDVVTIVDGNINPHGIRKEIDSYARENGKVIKKLQKFRTESGAVEEKEVFDRYEPRNNNEYVEIIVDHLSLLTTEKDSPTLKQTMEKTSRDFVTIRNRYHYIPVAVQQVSAESENIEHFKAAKLEPSKHALSDSKQTYNDCDIALGIFQPQRHNIKSYRGYNVFGMGDRYRNLNIFKNRYGVSNVNVGMYFDGAVNYFAELPKLDEIKDEHYSNIKTAKFRVGQ